MDTITGNKIPDDIRAKIESEVKKLDFINSIEEGKFIMATEFGYLLSVDKDKEISVLLSENEKLNKVLNNSIETSEKAIEKIDQQDKEIAEGRKEIERLKGEIWWAYNAGRSGTKWFKYKSENNL